MKDHTVKHGDCLTSIAEENGFFWETLWEHPKNAALKEKRKDPTVLLSGDVVHVPDKREKTESRATGARHKFRVKNVPIIITIRLVDDDGNPRADLAYTITVEGKDTKGKTGSDGVVTVVAMPSDKVGKLKIDNSDEEYTLQLGHLDPVTEPSGVQARLKGLGYLKVDVSESETPEATQALKQYQEDHGLEPSGKADEATQASLVDTYGI